jgi:TetR/AcrR family transcriptional repressor of nem operon
MKVTKARATENRRKLVHAAGRLFSRHGIGGVGVADIGKAAGLTHGAVYARFPSKQALAAEALADGTRQVVAVLRSCVANPAIGDYLDFSLCERSRDNLAGGCPLTATGSDVARQGKIVSRAFAEGFDELAVAIEEVLVDEADYATARERALAIAAAEIGTLIVARAVAKADRAFSDEILAASRRVLGEIGGE